MQGASRLDVLELRSYHASMGNFFFEFAEFVGALLIGQAFVIGMVCAIGGVFYAISLLA